MDLAILQHGSRVLVSSACEPSAVVAALVHVYVISRKNKTGACVVRVRAERRCGGARAADAAAAGVADAGTLGVLVTVGSRRVPPDVSCVPVATGCRRSLAT